MAIAAGDLLVTKVYCTAGDQTAINVRFWDVSAVTMAITDQQATDAISDKMGTLMKPMMGTAGNYYGCSLYTRVVNSRAPIALLGNSTVNSGTGSTASDVLPRQVSGIVAFKGSLLGHSVKGRAFIPFPPEVNNNANGHPDATYTGLLAALGTMYQGPTTFTHLISGATITLRGKLVPLSGTGDVAITIVTPRAKWATQRRRGDFGKVNAPPF